MHKSLSPAMPFAIFWKQVCQCVHFLHRMLLAFPIWYRYTISFFSLLLQLQLSFGNCLRGGRKRKTMKLSRDLSNLVVFTNSVASQECLNEGKNKTLDTSTIENQQLLCPLWLGDAFSCLTRVCPQVLLLTFCLSARPEPNLWSTTEPSNSSLSTRGSCHGFTPRPIASTHPISTLSFTGTWAVSWVRQLSAALNFWAIRRSARHSELPSLQPHTCHHTSTHCICIQRMTNFIYTCDIM